MDVREKRALLPSAILSSPPTPPTTASKFKSIIKTISILLSILIIADVSFHSIRRFTRTNKHHSGGGSRDVDICNQFDAKVPIKNELLDKNKDLIYSAEYRLKSVAIHSGLVKLHSESFDDLGAVGVDPRWDVFYDLSAYLLTTFPLLHSTLSLTKVNTHGLLYEWTGSDSSLKPSLLAAHQDTVPVNLQTLDLWTYPPWSGYYDGTYVWGRGSSDCKNTLSGILEAVTLLIEGGFKPKRTILLAFGFDEESKGYEGAGELSKVIEEKFGKDGIAFILDEGGLGIGEMYGAAFALPATGEKGYLDVNFTLHTPGGHSSIPPPHTGIGMLSTIITTLESSPYSPSLSLSSPIYSLLQCAAKYGDLPHSLKEAVHDGTKEGKKGRKAREEVAEKFAEFGRAQRYLVSTSQAVDVIGGGVKVNALPEIASFVVNYRISVDSNSGVVRNKIKNLVLPIAQKYSLDLDIFGELISISSTSSTEGQLTITGINQLEPAPVSPTSSEQWKILSSTIQHVYSKKFEEVGKGLIVSPCVMTGNTDSRYHWNLSQHIYRFTPADRNGNLGIHTVDEHVLIDDHISGIWFFHELLRNSDEAVFE